MTQPPPDNAVVIPLSQIYDKVVEIGADVRDLKGTLAPQVAEIKADVADHEARIRVVEQRPDPTDHETRIRVMEQRRFVPPSALWSAVGVAITAIATLATLLGVILH